MSVLECVVLFGQLVVTVLSFASCGQVVVTVRKVAMALIATSLAQDYYMQSLFALVVLFAGTVAPMCLCLCVCERVWCVFVWCVCVGGCICVCFTYPMSICMHTYRLRVCLCLSASVGLFCHVLSCSVCLSVCLSVLSVLSVLYV